MYGSSYGGFQPPMNAGGAAPGGMGFGGIDPQRLALLQQAMQARGMGLPPGMGGTAGPPGMGGPPNPWGGDPGMNKPLPVQWPGVTAPIQPPSPMGGGPYEASGRPAMITPEQRLAMLTNNAGSFPSGGGPQSITGGGFQSGPMGPRLGYGGAPATGPRMRPPDYPTTMAPTSEAEYLQQIGMNKPNFPPRGMGGPGPIIPGGMGRPPMFPPGIMPPGGGGPGVGGIGAPPGNPPRSATPIPGQQKMVQGRPVVERGGVTGIEGRAGRFQKLGAAATRRMR